MMADVKPIKVWGTLGPNPPKVYLILEELGLAYEPITVKITDVKNPEYLAINPNGRLPSIYDPNTDLTLWESGAIIEYLIERYDTDHKISFAPGTAEAAHAKQWNFFQASGQGPYYGQAAWFMRYHPEQVPSALDRYLKEISRVTGVLESHLAKQKVNDHNNDGPWLVGNKCSYADLVFKPWQVFGAKMIKSEGDDTDEFPHVTKWMENITSRKSTKVVVDLMESFKST